MKLKLIPFLLVSILLASACKKNNSSTQKTGNVIRAHKSDWLPGDSLVDGTYRIYTDNNLTLSTDLSKSDESNIRLFDYVPTKGQRWNIKKTADGYYTIINVNSGKSIDVPFNLSNTGVRLWQFTANGNPAQLFSIQYQNGLYRIVTKNGLAIGVETAKQNEAYITQDTNTDSALQQWQMEKVDEDPDEPQPYFYNPLLPSGADPFVTQKDGFYYYLNTTGANITIRKTAKMSELSDAPAKIVWTPPSGTAYSKDLWAPEMYYYAPKGKWYVFFTADDGTDGNHRMNVIVNSSADPTTGTWTYAGKLADPSNLWSIDGTVLYYANKLYLIWSGWRTSSTSNSGIQQLYIAQISSTMGITTPRVMIAEPTYSWEKNGLVNEGPEILKNPAGDVFLIYSGSGCWTDDYKLGMIKLTAGGDPLNAADWVKAPDPVLEKSIANSVYAPGHNGFFTSVDGKENWIIYHANNATGLGCGGSRSPRIQKFTWNADGTPNFGIPVKTGVATLKPSGE